MEWMVDIFNNSWMPRLVHSVGKIFQRAKCLSIVNLFCRLFGWTNGCFQNGRCKNSSKVGGLQPVRLLSGWLLALCTSGSRVRHFSHQWSISEISWTLKPFTISPLFCSLFHYVVVWTATTLLLSSPVKAAESKMSTTQTISFLKRLLFPLIIPAGRYYWASIMACFL